MRSSARRRQLHTVIAAWCTGCELCVPSCPVDCIHMVPWPQVACRRRPPKQSRAATARTRRVARARRERARELRGSSAARSARERHAAMTPAACRSFYCALRAANPEPRTELAVRIALPAAGGGDPLGAGDRQERQCRDAPACSAWRPRRRPCCGWAWPGLKRHIRTIGLFNSKARHIIAASQQLLELHGGEVPAERDRARSAARASAARRPTWCSMPPLASRRSPSTPTSSASPIAPVSRRGARRARSRSGCWQVTPAEFRLHAHHWLILLGRYVCKARRPQCPRCPVRRWCGYPDKTARPGSGRRRSHANPCASSAGTDR